MPRKRHHRFGSPLHTDENRNHSVHLTYHTIMSHVKHTYIYLPYILHTNALTFPTEVTSRLCLRRLGIQKPLCVAHIRRGGLRCRPRKSQALLCSRRPKIPVLVINLRTWKLRLHHPTMNPRIDSRIGDTLYLLRISSRPNPLHLRNLCMGVPHRTESNQSLPRTLPSRPRDCSLRELWSFLISVNNPYITHYLASTSEYFSKYNPYSVSMTNSIVLLRLHPRWDVNILRQLQDACANGVCES